jgi:adenine phosphoribosyltransferase
MRFWNGTYTRLLKEQTVVVTHLDAGTDPQLDAQLAAVVEGVLGFPREGVRFTDVGAVWEQEPSLFTRLVDRMCDPYEGAAVPVLLAIEAQGFLFAGAMAHVLGARVVMARKGPRPRLPREIVTQEYVSGYEGGLILGAHRDAVHDGDQVLVVDDVLATGWSAVGGVRLAEKMGANCVGVTVAVELGHLPGRANLMQHAGAQLMAAARTPETWGEPATSARG